MSTMQRLILIIVVVIIPGVLSGNWMVTVEDQCALKGTSGVIKCTYDYPWGHFVTAVSWSKALYVAGQWKKFLLSELTSPPNHFTYVGDYWSDCSLKVNDVQHTDEGEYFFSFVTTLNRWTSETPAHLSVRELTSDVQPSTVTEGENVNLTCVSGCLTPINIVWFRDGQRAPNPAFQAKREDAGRYDCAVLEQQTVRSASVALNVQYAPSNVMLSVDPSAVKGSWVTFTCSSDANPPVAQSGYSLYKDGYFISSGHNHTISDLQLSHSGLYYCQAWNNISWRGIDLVNSTEVHLDVQYAPSNVTLSVDPSAVKGSWVTFTCSSDANPPVAQSGYSLYKDGYFISSGQNHTISDLQLSHSGLYYCQAWNNISWRGIDLVNSTEVHLDVQYAPSNVTLSVDPSAVKGSWVTFTCSSDANPPVAQSGYSLYKDGYFISSGQNHTISDLQLSHSGLYYCQAWNNISWRGIDLVNSTEVHLDVQYAPSNVTLSVDPSAVKGSWVTLTCSSDANPPVAQSGYSLYKDGYFISSGQNHTISDLQLSHSGLYYCQAWNNISWRGIDLVNSTEVHLDVQYRPENVSISMDPPHVVEGSGVNLTCSSAANPAADGYTWYRSTGSNSSSLLQVGSGPVLSLPSVEASHMGLYLCQARNQLGGSNSTEALLSAKGKDRGFQSLKILAGIGVSVLVAALFLFWLKQRTSAKKKAPRSHEDTVTYSTGTITPRNPGSLHVDNSWSKDGENDDSVIYTSPELD